MNVQAASGKLSLSRRALYQQAMQASLRVRAAAGFDLKRPICIYALCNARGVTVRFNAINMEGMYDRLPRPRIHLSALRPLVRRTFNCGHELGHHEFGHGSTIDELREEAASARWDQPNEILADTFSAFVLMPSLGLREAFSLRHTTPDKASPAQTYAVACNFGVGYSTLVTHLAFGIETLTPFRRAFLSRHSPRSIRAEYLGESTTDPLVIVDDAWTAPSIDVEEGHLIWVPAAVQITPNVAVLDRIIRGGRLYRAIAPGLGRATRIDSGWASYVRVARREYVGLADYRHLEDATDD